MIKKFLKDESGQGMVEYILIVALIAIAAIGALKAFNTNLSGLFGKAGKKLASEGNEIK